MKYYKIQFEYGYEGEGYQEVNDSEQYFSRLTDLSGNTLNIENDYGYFITDDNPPKPDWAE